MENEYMNKIFCHDAMSMAELPDESIDALVTDPPSGIAFMSMEWDKDKGGRNQWIAWLASIMREAYRTMKPGAHGLVWALPRTSHWTAMALEDAGFEVRDMVSHIFACLTDDAEILTQNGWMKRENVTHGMLVMAYDCKTDSFQWQRVEHLYQYEYNDSVFKITGKNSEHKVSRGHNCVIERDGNYVLSSIEEVAQEREARIPVLESVSNMLQAFSMLNEGTGCAEQDMRGYSVQEGMPSKQGEEAAPALSKMWENCGIKSKKIESSIGEDKVLFEEMLGTGEGENAWVSKKNKGNLQDGTCCMDGEEQRKGISEDDWGEKSGMEGRRDVFQKAWELQADKIYSMPRRFRGDGEEGRIRNGTSNYSSAGFGQTITQDRGSSSYESRLSGQPPRESRSLQEQSGSQALRGKRFTTSDMVKIIEEPYCGVVWCISVSSRAFVAREKGAAFITGNSGFPKSQNISLMIDKATGAERKVIGIKPGHETTVGRDNMSSLRDSGVLAKGFSRPWMRDPEKVLASHMATAPATEDATKWDGWGTALKPAVEFFILIRKPLAEKTIAANVVKYGTGGLNIDASRIGYKGGRWPANLLLSHDPRCAESCVEECPVAELDRQSGVTSSRISPPCENTYGNGHPGWQSTYQINRGERGYTDTGGASRFFQVFSPGESVRFQYIAKASVSEKEANLGDEFEPAEGIGAVYKTLPDPRMNRPQQRSLRKNTHPTVKPLELMRYLITLITPPGGTILDCFAGSGTTLLAADQLGFRWVGYEQNPEYVRLAQARLSQRSLFSQEERDASASL